MTEVPEHLLQRSRERRAALGLSTEGEAGESPAPADKADVAGTPAAAAASPPAPPEPSAPAAPEPEPEPEPVPAVVQAAMSRSRIPVWAMPVLAMLPLWALFYAATMTAPEEPFEDTLAIGEEIFTLSCVACHGAGGRGGVGPALADPQLLETFPERSEMIDFVTAGSQSGVPYGQAGDIGTGGMPAWGTQLSEEEIVAVVRYAREVLAGEEPDPDDEADDAGTETAADDHGS